MRNGAVGAVLLAAGGSSRYGQPKQLLEWKGRPLVAHLADVIWMAGVEPLVVVGAEAETVSAALKGRPVRVLRNYGWREGLSSSVRLGLAALAPEVEAALFLQVDQPLVSPSFLQALVKRWRETEAGIVVPTWEGRRGSPVLFDRSLFAELAEVSGDAGGRQLLETHAGRIEPHPVADPRLLTDVDRPEAYEKLRAEAEQDPAGLLSSVRAVIADMDGVLWREGVALPGLHAFFELLERQKLPYTLVTNNSSRTPEQYVEKLGALGVSTTVEHVLNSAVATADYLREETAPGALVYAIGGVGLREALRDRGFHLSEGKEAEVVAVGWDRELTWEKMATATRLIRRGARFVGTNPDRTFPSEEGLVPGAGAQLALLKAATDIEPIVAGKPEPILYEQALTRMGSAAGETLMIGDRLDTDILGGIRCGMPTALLLSGVQRREELRTSPIHADLIFEDLAALVAAWRELEQ